MDWLEKVFGDRATLYTVVGSAITGLIGSLSQGVMQKKHGGWPGFFSALIVGVSVSVIVGLGIKDYIASDTLRLAIVGAAAVISDDILAGLRAVGRLVREDPLGSLGRLIDALRGAKAPTTTKPPEAS
jgi:hypothetical protein